MGGESQPARVDVERVDGVRTVLFNAPHRLNALTDELLVAAEEGVRAAYADGDRVVVLRGAGRGFCAGADIRGGGAAPAGPTAAGSTVRAAEALVRAIVASPVPVVAVVQGPAAGVGVSIALAADLVLCSSAAFFQLAFTRIGLMPDGGSSALVAASVGRATAMRMALLAERLTAEEALARGLVTAVVEPDALEPLVTATVEHLRHGPAAAYARTKEAINATTLTELDAAFDREHDGQVRLLAAPDFAEGTAAFAAKRPPVFIDQP